ncbi:MAG: hypothetical protein K2J69_02365, partial [Malacoplasma sp.]|nr:hypothetical protein [Malacoplasma sp.]
MFSKLSFNVDKKTFSRFLLLAPYLIITILLIVIPLILVFIKPFQPTVDSATNESIAISNNWSFLGATIWEKIGLSFLVAIIVR